MNAAHPRAPLGPTGLAARGGGAPYVIIRTNHKPQRVGPVQASTLGPVLVTAPKARSSSRTPIHSPPQYSAGEPCSSTRTEGAR